MLQSSQMQRQSTRILHFNFLLNQPALEEEGGGRYFAAVLSEESLPLLKAWMSQVWALSPTIYLQNCLAYVGAQR